MKKEKFPYEIPEGAVMDFVDGRFLLVVKDDEWNEEELAAFEEEPCQVSFCWTNGLAIFVVEGGPIDSSDLYFNIQDCDERDAILALTSVVLEVVLVDKKNQVCWKKKMVADEAVSAAIVSCLQEQAEMKFMPGEYDVNVEGLMSSYEPFELLKWSRGEIR